MIRVVAYKRNGGDWIVHWIWELELTYRQDGKFDAETQRILDKALELVVLHPVDYRIEIQPVLTC